MKFFEPRIMMQEHRQLIKRASAEEKDSWAAPAQILKTP
jgi:hypothetical protein